MFVDVFISNGILEQWNGNAPTTLNVAVLFSESGGIKVFDKILLFAISFLTPREAIEATFEINMSNNPEYNPDVIKTSRKQRVKRTQMKKQSQKKPRTKKTMTLPAEVAWHVRAQGLPLALFHTTIGPIIGHVEKVDDPDAGSFGFRLWAPAAIRMGFHPGQRGVFVVQHSVTFQPIALVETYLDLSAETPFGRSPVPEALVPSYADYLARVAAGEYSFTRVTAHVQRATPHEVPIETSVETPAEDATTQEPALADPDAIDPDAASDETDLS